MLTDFAYDQLFVWFMDGRFEANESISIDGIAQELDVSPTPVREALARLESTGLVARVALRGYRAAPLATPEELGQLMDARCAIEPVNARLVCEQATPELFADLEQTVIDLQKAPHGPSFQEFRPYWEADERFHRLIAEHAGNPFLLTAYNTLGGQIQRFRLFGNLGVTDADMAIAEHRDILNALRERDGESAAQRMTKHLLNVKHRATLESNGSSRP